MIVNIMSMALVLANGSVKRNVRGESPPESTSGGWDKMITE